MSPPTHTSPAPPVPAPRSNGDASASPALVESYRRLADVFHDVLSEQSLDAVLERIADTIVELIPHDDLAFYEADEPNRLLRPVLARGQYADEVLADEPFAFGLGITGWAVDHRQPVLANRADLDPRVRFVEGTPPDPEALIAVPLIARGQIKGALNIYRAGLNEFTDEELRLAVRFGDAAALALDNAEVRAGLELQAQTDHLTGLWNHRAFHERLRNEVVRASSEHGSVALLMLDLDDFKRVNDIHGHAVGDQVLAELAAELRTVVRQTDDVCRTGGEEFAIIVPEGDITASQNLAQRIAERIALADFYPAGPLTVSIGIALCPDHAANPRELVACAELAMMTAKARGKRRIVVFHESESERPTAPAARGGEIRSIAHLKMLHGVSSKLSRLLEIDEIGTTIADELRQLIDYHNCRVFLRDGDDLRPVAFRGDFSESSGAALDVLATKVGVGVTGHVAESGAPFLTGDAANCGIGKHIDGTPRIEESLLAVPLRYGSAVVGVLVLSKLGLDQFDDDDLRLLEVLAGHASVALVNARLYEAQRREAEGAKALLELSGELSACTEIDAVAERVARGAARILGLPRATVWLPLGNGEGLECRSRWPVDDPGEHARPGDRLPAAAIAPLTRRAEPFVIAREDYAHLVAANVGRQAADAYAIAPIALDSGYAALTLALDHVDDLDDRQLDLLAGIAAQAKLALASALSFETLKRTFLATAEELEARTTFVCDAFHAMTTARPYREALPVEEARRRLREAAGSQFDPKFVDVCLRVLDAGAPH